jgi:hypothetical protein
MPCEMADVSFSSTVSIVAHNGWMVAKHGGWIYVIPIRLSFSP